MLVKAALLATRPRAPALKMVATAVMMPMAIIPRMRQGLLWRLGAGGAGGGGAMGSGVVALVLPSQSELLMTLCVALL